MPRCGHCGKRIPDREERQALVGQCKLKNGVVIDKFYACPGSDGCRSFIRSKLDKAGWLDESKK